MADDQGQKNMGIDDLVRELSKSSTSPGTPPMSAPQANRSPFPTAPSTGSGPSVKPPMSPPMAGSPTATPAPKPFVPVVPTTNPAPRPQFNAPLPPLNQSKPVPSPVTPPPTTSGVKEYQSSIRTMNDDISRLKQGQKPAGIDVPRKIEQFVSAVPQQPIPPKPVMPSQQFKVPSVNLGETRKASPMAPSRDIPKPPIAPTPKVEEKPHQIYVPQEVQRGGNRNMLFLGIGAVALVAGFAYWFFVLRSSAPVIVEETPTPTPTEIPTPTPSPLEKLGVIDKISIPSTSVFWSSLSTEMNNKAPVAGQIRLYDVIDENQQKYSFKEFLTKLEIDISTINDSGLLDTKEWVLGSYGQLGTGQGPSTRSFIVLTQKDVILANNLMNSWEPRMISDLAKLFNLGKTSSLVFTPDVYSNISFRFVRIPNKDLGIAYAVFENYILVGSSRDSFRVIVDILATPPPLGK